MVDSFTHVADFLYRLIFKFSSVYCFIKWYLEQIEFFVHSFLHVRFFSGLPYMDLERTYLSSYLLCSQVMRPDHEDWHQSCHNECFMIEILLCRYARELDLSPKLWTYKSFYVKSRYISLRMIFVSKISLHHNF